MRILIYSDLHLESHSFTPPRAAVKQADVVVLAGDIKEGGGLASARKMFPDKEIVYVAGNHEFYDDHWGRALARMRSQAKNLSIHFLENNEVTLDGIRFLGCTLWTDFLFFGPKLEDLVKLECCRYMPDYRAIWVNDDKQDLAQCNEFGFPPKRLVNPDDIQRLHRQSRTWLEAAMAEGDPAKTVVVTHHLPHQRSVARRYKQHRTSGAYASRLPADLIQRCGLWVHGHSHDSVNHRFGDARHETRVV
ncbi:MAG: metallophosphoesterase [Hydrogenophaga sp.]|uniref:metallophosphoesterase n=1 Tax=Hydrogenophaga sp. TaxID=1904254 RepID=UPI002ABB6C94|nr:metallophosphoesterase [Hydrogenophaga sp.]MDZ4188305.1 metallophosphoesterase [Hydrogenophaga sp.]